MVNSAEFTKRLEKILHYYGLSATAFSEKIQFNRSTISHLLSGRNKPSLEFVLKVVETFPEVQIYWLLNGKGDFPPAQPSASDSNTDVQSSAPSKNIQSDLPNPRAHTKPGSEQTTPTSVAVERIVIFYSDGSFKEYLP